MVLSIYEWNWRHFNWSFRGLNVLLRNLRQGNYIVRLKGATAHRLQSVHCNDSIKLVQFNQKAKHIVAQPNTEAMFRHKFHQFCPFIQKLAYTATIT